MWVAMRMTWRGLIGWVRMHSLVVGVVFGSGFSLFRRKTTEKELKLETSEGS